MTVEKQMAKCLLRPITSGANSTMNQSEYLTITRDLLKAREESAYKVSLLWFCFSSVKLLCETLKSITTRSHHNREITFDSHLKISRTESLLQILCPPRMVNSLRY